MTKQSLVREVLSSTLAQLLATGIFAAILWFGGTLLLPSLSELPGASAAKIIVLLLVFLILAMAWLIFLSLKVSEKPRNADDFNWDDEYAVHLDSKTGARYCPKCLSDGKLGRMKFIESQRYGPMYECTVCMNAVQHPST